MLRSDLIKIIQKEKNWLTEEEAEKIVKTIFKEIRNKLYDGHRIELRGFGVFSLRKQKERKGRNPKTGETVIIPERKTVHFKMSKILLKKLNQDN